MIMRPQSILIVALVLLTLAPASALAVYHPRMGRFMQRDPKGTSMIPQRIERLPSGHFIGLDSDPIQQYRDGANVYQYVRSNPVYNLDPSGLEALFSVAITETGKASIGARIQVRLDRHELNTCRKIRFIQLVKEHNVGFLMEQQTGWEVDSKLWRGLPPYLPWYINSIESPDTSLRNKDTDYEWWAMGDQPGLDDGDRYAYRVFSLDFETCAICLCGRGANTRGRMLGCVKWGMFWAKGTKNYSERLTYYGDHPLGPGHSPSIEMLKVLRKFMDQWNGFPIDIPDSPNRRA